MTHPANTAPLRFRDLAETIAALRSRGLRITASRRLALEALFAASGPLSAGYIAREAVLDLPSVHRNLETFERLGLVRHVHLGHGPGLYALRRDGELDYLYCELCGAIRAAPAEELDPIRQSIREQFGYEASFAHFAIPGTCPKCSREHPGEPATGRATEGDRAAVSDEHHHEHPHSHSHEHDDGTQHQHAHTHHDHEHIEHEHEHSHGDHIHTHAHAHEEGLEDQHEH